MACSLSLQLPKPNLSLTDSNSGSNGNFLLCGGGCWCAWRLFPEEPAAACWDHPQSQGCPSRPRTCERLLRPPHPPAGHVNLRGSLSGSPGDWLDWSPRATWLVSDPSFASAEPGRSRRSEMCISAASPQTRHFSWAFFQLYADSFKTCLLRCTLTF